MLPSTQPVFSYFQWHLLVQLTAVGTALVPFVNPRILFNPTSSKLTALHTFVSAAVLALTQGYDADAFYFVNLRLVLVPACLLYLASAIITICIVYDTQVKDKK